MLLVRGYGGFDLECHVLTVTCGAVVVLVDCCAVRFTYLISLVDCWFSLALSSSSASYMVALKISTSLSSALIIFLSICLFIFSWRLTTVLRLNLLSVLVGWYL